MGGGGQQPCQPGAGGSEGWWSVPFHSSHQPSGRLLCHVLALGWSTFLLCFSFPFSFLFLSSFPPSLPPALPSYLPSSLLSFFSIYTHTHPHTPWQGLLTSCLLLEGTTRSFAGKDTLLELPDLEWRTPTCRHPHLSQVPSAADPERPGPFSLAATFQAHSTAVAFLGKTRARLGQCTLPCISPCSPHLQ